ncbi:squalene/phytoene synthase family protein, partial [Mycobacterium interjectum]|nr:squalene/phytoene synthase family protein [Mycobacterium interjectum]
MPTAEKRADRPPGRLPDRLEGPEAGQHDEPVLAAVDDTVRRYGIPADLFEDFLDSMRMDLTVTDY